VCGSFFLSCGGFLLGFFSLGVFVFFGGSFLCGLFLSGVGGVVFFVGGLLLFLVFSLGLGVGLWFWFGGWGVCFFCGGFFLRFWSFFFLGCPPHEPSFLTPLSKPPFPMELHLRLLFFYLLSMLSSGYRKLGFFFLFLKTPFAFLNLSVSYSFFRSSIQMFFAVLTVPS